MGDRDDEPVFDILLPVPEVDKILPPIIVVIPLQLLSYPIASHRGLEVDHPEIR